MYGWAGKVLEVDLSEERIKELELEEELAYNFLGGRGLGAKILYYRVGPDVKPFDPENLLVFAVGPLTGTLAPTSGRHSVATKSPLTGTILDSNSGGYWGAELKFAGFDAIIVSGQASRPVYLWVHNGSAELKDASGLWGKGTHASTDAICKQLGDGKVRVACIGPAGERFVKFAAIINDKNRAAGRGGVGAVMGSKRLKAVAVKGSRPVKIANEAAFKVFVKECQKVLHENPFTSTALPMYGTAFLMNIVNEHGILPTRNFQTGVFSSAEKLSGERIRETILVRGRGCFACPIPCGRVTKVGELEVEGPEYGTLCAFGAQCGVDDLEVIARANLLCNDLGLDTISMGSTIGCAMELSERGRLDGPKFGGAEGIAELIRKTATREGLGEKLAEGSARLAEESGAPELSMSVKGLELPAYDPRGVQGLGLAYATSNRGGCHLRAYTIAQEVLGTPYPTERFSTAGKPEQTAILQDQHAVMDSLVLCRFTSLALKTTHYAKLLTAATGIEFTDEDLMKIGERIYNLERLYNLREGFSAEDDTLPKRLIEEPMPEGPSEGRRHMLPRMLSGYYACRGWGSDGVPTEEKLRELGLA